MKKTYAFGIIPVRKTEQNLEVFIVKHKAGHWGFPKGHAEPNETPKQTAERELYEETGLSITEYLAVEPITIKYQCISHGEHVDKTVVFFLAHVTGQAVLCQDEIAEGLWASLKDAEAKITNQELVFTIKQIFMAI